MGSINARALRKLHRSAEAILAIFYFCIMHYNGIYAYPAFLVSRQEGLNLKSKQIQILHSQRLVE